MPYDDLHHPQSLRAAPLHCHDPAPPQPGSPPPYLQADADFEAIFELAPVSLWLEDFSALRALFERWRAEGVTDLAAHLAAHPPARRRSDRVPPA